MNDYLYKEIKETAGKMVSAESGTDMRHELSDTLLHIGEAIKESEVPLHKKFTRMFWVGFTAGLSMVATVLLIVTLCLVI